MQPTFGAIQRQPDIRDYPLGAFTPETFPEKYFTEINWCEVENQRKIPACGSHSGAFLMEEDKTDRWFSTRVRYDNGCHL
jgi:hypothetical protein